MLSKLIQSVTFWGGLVQAGIAPIGVIVEAFMAAKIRATRDDGTEITSLAEFQTSLAAARDAAAVLSTGAQDRIERRNEGGN